MVKIDRCEGCGGIGGICTCGAQPPADDQPEYSEGIAGDGVAILRNGVPMVPGEIVAALRTGDGDQARRDALHTAALREKEFIREQRNGLKRQVDEQADHVRRYQWLRTHYRFQADSMREIWFDDFLVAKPGEPEELDAAIDTALAAIAAEGGGDA